jgi:asparagine synthase (glutamine-hydrolysing)
VCGIVGIVSCSEDSPVDPGTIRKMADSIVHRGPDDEGYFVRPNIALGNRRLSIIDVDGGKQPISTSDKRFTIVFNGEIFNYKKLREELRSQGYPFRTDSDTEVVLAGFARQGSAFFDRLDGMFACLIYDSAENLVYAARDSFGIKPLYTYRSGNFLYLASEIKAIRAVAPVRFEINPVAAQTYFRLGYVVGRDTLVQGLHRVSPGSVLKIRSDGEMIEEPFVNRLLPSTLALRQKLKFNVERTVIEAIGQSMVSDVAVGLYLSGGIDSSLIASVVRREFDQKLDSFSVCFPGEGDHDEGAYAEIVAKELGLPHESIAAGPEDFSDLRQLIRTLEEPMADPSAAALFKLSGLVSKRLKVVLSGEGGDELFGGYHRYFWDRFATRYQNAPWSIRAMGKLAGQVAPPGRFRRRAQKLHESIHLQRHERYAAWFAHFRPGEAVFKGPRSHAAEKILEGAFAFASPLSETAQVQWVDLVTFLRDDLLPKADRMSMAHSVEARVPFLQASVVEAAFSIPDAARVRARESKPILRAMLRKYLPAQIVDRKKQGFEVPVGNWLRGPLKFLLEQHLSKEAIERHGFLDFTLVSKIVSEHQSGAGDRGLALYSLCLFQAWCEEFL